MSENANSSSVNIRKSYINLEWLNKHLHLSVMFITVFLVFSSPWLFMSRKLTSHGSWINVAHVYLGIVVTFLSLCFLIIHCINGYWKQFFPWLKGDISPLKNDLKNIFKGRFPVAGGRGLFSCIEGIGLLTLLATGLTGCLWFAIQGTTDAMYWRSIHSHFAVGFIVYLGMHFVCALSHCLAFLRN